MEDDASMVGTDTSVTALTQALRDPHVEKVNKNDSIYFVLFSRNVQNLKIILRQTTLLSESPDTRYISYFYSYIADFGLSDRR